jgi:hypothetical protein
MLSTPPIQPTVITSGDTSTAPDNGGIKHIRMQMGARRRQRAARSRVHSARQHIPPDTRRTSMREFEIVFTDRFDKIIARKLVRCFSRGQAYVQAKLLRTASCARFSVEEI